MEGYTRWGANLTTGVHLDLATCRLADLGLAGGRKRFVARRGGAISVATGGFGRLLVMLAECAERKSLP